MPGSVHSAAVEPARWRPRLRMLSARTAPLELALNDLNADRDGLELAKRAAAGERAAQRALFEALKRPMHSMLYRVLGANRNMEDLLQEAFIELFRSLPSYRGDAKLSTWADRITTRVAYRYMRRQRPAIASEGAADDAAALLATPEAELQAKEGLRRVYAALSTMKPEYRIAFALFAIDGRSLKEVADATSVSVIAAKSRVWRARRLLNTRARSDAVLAAYLGSSEPFRSSH
jgi:RNA polymerase sigma-70 factor, ECF subfamily